MANLDAPWDDNYEFDTEVWLQLLLMVTSDQKQKDKMVKRIAEKTGLPLEKVEVVIASTMNIMAIKARSN